MAVTKYEDLTRRLLDTAGIQINGPNPWDIQVHDERFYPRLFCEGRRGLGESYMDGWWDCGQLDELIARALAAGVQDKLPRNLSLLTLHLRARWTNRQSKRRAWAVADQHYNLGNGLFQCTFDARLTGAAPTGTA